MLSVIAVMEGCRAVRRSTEGAITERRFRSAPAGPRRGR